jgi:hypothetical protein
VTVAMDSFTFAVKNMFLAVDLTEETAAVAPT